MPIDNQLDEAFGGYIYRLPPAVIEANQQHPLLTDLIVTRLGYFPRAAQHSISRPDIDEYILMYCAGGVGWLTFPDAIWKITAGQIAVVFRDMAHGYRADEANPWTIYWAHLNGANVGEFLALAGMSVEQPVCSIGTQTPLPLLFQDMANILQSGYGLHQLVWASQILGQVLGYIAYKATYAGRAAANDLNVEQVIQLMLENLTQSCSLETLANAVNMSPSHFSRRFHEKTGYAPIDYYIRLKIQKACELLEMSALSISEISDHLGYSTPYYFSRIFKKITGQSPRQYRQSF